MRNEKHEKRRKKEKRPQKEYTRDGSKKLLFFETNVVRNREAIEAKKIKF